MPRGLILLSALWLIASWLLAMGFTTPIQPSSASYTPGVRMMFICIVIGLMIGWPLLRLSERPIAWPRSQALLDAISLIALLQVVMWPLRLVTPWSVPRMAAMDAMLICWILLIAAMLAAVLATDRQGPRSLAMLLFVILFVAAPAVVWLSGMTWRQATPYVGLSPLTAFWMLADGGGARITSTNWWWVTPPFIGAAAGWLVLGLTGLWSLRKSPDLDPHTSI